LIKVILFISLYVSSLVANVYNFTEIRYSDAIGYSVEMKGQIEFLENGLNVFYPKASKSFKYKDDILKYIDGSQEIDLDEMQKEQIKKYFDILILLHQDDKKKLNEMFKVVKNLEKTILKPKDNIKNYLIKIELLKQHKQLKSVKLFLKNSDNITINIDDEIR